MKPIAYLIIILSLSFSCSRNVMPSTSDALVVAQTQEKPKHPQLSIYGVIAGMFFLTTILISAGK